MTRFFLIILYLALNSQLSSQEIVDNKVVYNYTTKDGLAGNQVLCSMQDSKGYMWFGTGGGGVSRFNGHSFQTFNIADGLTDNEVFTMHEDASGRIWFGTYNLQISYFYNDSIYEYEHNEAIRENISNFGLVSNLHYTIDGYLYLYFVNAPMVKISPEGRIFDNSSNKLNAQVDVHFFPDKTLVSSFVTLTNRDVFELRMHQGDNLLFKAQKNDMWDIPTSGYQRSFATLDDSDTLLFINSNILKINPSTFENASLSDQSSILQSQVLVNVFKKDDIYWLCLTNNGIIRARIANGAFEIIDHIFQNEFITYISDDNEGGLWLCSHDRGLFYMPYPKIDSSKKKAIWQKRAKNLTVRDEENMAFAISPKMAVIKHHNCYDTLEFNFSKSEYISHFKYSHNGDSLIINGPYLFNIYKVGQTGLQLIFSDQQYTGVDIDIGENNEILIVRSNYIFSSDHFWQERIPIFRSNNRVRVIEAIENRILVGSNSGLEEFILKNHKWKLNELVGDSEIYNSFIQDFEKYRHGVWIATRGKGIAFYTDSVEFVIGIEQGLSNTNLTDLKQDGDTLWVSSDSGLDKLVFDENLNVISNGYFNSTNGLSSDYLNGVEVSEKAIYISTELGIDRINRSDLASSQSPNEVFVRNLEIHLNDEDSTSSSQEFTHKQNDLQISYEAIEFRARGNQEFRYRLEPIHSSWNYTKRRVIDFNDLTPESYKFSVQVKDFVGNWSSSKYARFTINPPFWSTWYFKIVSALLFLLGIFYAIKRRERIIKDKFLLESKVESLREKALRAQINPHFLFNTLNSIQKYILLENFEASNKYITQFSRLIRMILSQSDKDFTTINDEVSILTMYMNLEKMRFDQAFDFKVSVSEEIDSHVTTIPSMMVQPYVENAIWHGLAKTDRKGTVTVTFRKGLENRSNSHIECIVIDNGIGREAARKMQKKNNKNRTSVGMSITKKRLDIFDSNSTGDIKIIDLYTKDGRAEGTEIRIHLPFKIKNQI